MVVRSFLHVLFIFVSSRRPPRSTQRSSSAAAYVYKRQAEIRSAALAELNAERAEALSGARTQVAELAGTAASKVLGRTVDPAVAQRIAETYLAPSEN
mgnify:CR=1 FL=1